MSEEQKPTRAHRTGRPAPTYFEIKREFKPVDYDSRLLRADYSDVERRILAQMDENFYKAYGFKPSDETTGYLTAADIDRAKALIAPYLREPSFRRYGGEYPLYSFGNYISRDVDTYYGPWGKWRLHLRREAYRKMLIDYADRQNGVVKPLTIWQKFLLSPVGRWFATHDDLETWLLCATVGTFTGASLAPSVTGFAIGCTLGAGLLVYSWLRPRD